MSSTYSVYTGIWRNWNGNTSDGSLVLTVSPTAGPYIIALSALFVRTVMSHIWTLLCLAMHQLRATNAPRSGFYHQIQALLSGSPDSATTLLVLLKMIWRWHLKSVGVFRGSAPIVATAVLHLLLLTAAALLSSRVTSAGDEVLVRADTCGWMNGGSVDTGPMTQIQLLDWDLAAYNFGRYTAFQSLKYVQACYNTTSITDLATCRFYASSSLTSNVNQEYPCPFSNSSICATPHAMQVDTGYIDSDTDLGINAPTDSQIRFRKLLTCVPTAVEEQFSSNWTSTPPPGLDVSGDAFKYYYLGPSSQGNYTWVMDNRTFWNLGRSPYSIGSVSGFAGFNDNLNFSTFSPIPQLRVNRSDVSFLLLTSQANYAVQVKDPWYRATTNRSSGSDDLFPWQPDRVVSALGCTEQYQFCNQAQCSELDGLYLNNTLPFVGLDLNDAQKAVFNLVWNAVWGVTVNFAVLTLGDQLLLSKNYLVSPTQLNSAPLPSTQWQAEVRNMADVMLAALQRRVVDFASPPDISVSTVLNGTVSSRAFVVLSATDGENTLCSSVRVRDARYYNFSVAGLAIILAVGMGIILLNVVFMPGLAFWVQDRLGWDEYPRRSWLESRLFRLLRTAVGKNSEVEWEVTGYEPIPVTVRDGAVFPGEAVWKSP